MRFCKTNWWSFSLILCLATAVQAAPYTTGFEAPTFSLGAVVGQDNWTSQGLSTMHVIQNTLVRTGNQAVQIDAEDSTRFPGIWQNLTLGAADGNTVRISVDMLFSTSSLLSERQVFFVTGPTGALIGSLEYRSDGQVGLISREPFRLFAGPTRDEWHNWSFTLNFQAQTMTVAIDDVILAANVLFQHQWSPITTVGQAAFLYDNPGNDKWYIDNFSATAAVPEPSSFVLAGLGGLLIPLVRRKRTK